MPSITNDGAFGLIDIILDEPIWNFDSKVVLEIDYDFAVNATIWHFFFDAATSTAYDSEQYFLMAAVETSVVAGSGTLVQTLATYTSYEDNWLEAEERLKKVIGVQVVPEEPGALAITAIRYTVIPNLAVSVTHPIELDSVELSPPPQPSGSYAQKLNISGSTGDAYVDFTNADLEAGPTYPAGVTKAVWLIWTPGDQAAVTQFNAGEASIQLAPYVEGALASEYTPTITGEGTVTVYADETTQWLIQLGWRVGDEPTPLLTWVGGDPPYYDNFETPYDLAIDAVGLTTNLAGVQVGEPLPPGADASVWVRWVADIDGATRVKTSDPALDITVYENGAVLGSLVEVATGVGLATFTAIALDTYLFQIVEV